MTGDVEEPSDTTGILARIARRRPRGAQAVVVAVATLAALLCVGTAAVYKVDASHHHGRSVEGLTINTTSFGGLSRDQVIAKLQALDGTFGSTKVDVKVDGDNKANAEDFVTDAASLGMHIDVEATTTRILAAGRSGSLPSQIIDWLQRKLGSHSIALVTRVDRKIALDAVAARSRDGEDPPVEASISVGRSSKVFVGVGGRSGQGIDAERLIHDLPSAAARGGDPIRITARRGAVSPRFNKDDATALAAEAERLVAAPLDLAAAGQAGQLTPGMLRALITSLPGADRLELEIDGKAAADAAAKVLVKAGSAATEPSFHVNPAGGVDITPGAAGTSCCGPDAPSLLSAAIRTRPAGPVQLQLIEAQPKMSLEAAQALGVKEMVSTFTTKHPAGQPRVMNIHHIADLVRGQVILPGEALSINALIGPRTLEKGFVVDHVIEDGKFAESVGGGISQFATTLFNASWFAGMDYGEYQSHSLYISRYPYGREATLNFPHPDLKVKNPSPYGVLIWPTYTGTSLTVTLYSTKWVEVAAVGQDKVAEGSCTKVTAKRQKTFLDGRVVNDSTTARYRANEGQNCGDAQPPPPDGASTTSSTATTKPGTPTTTSKPATTTTTKTTPSTTAHP